MIELFNCLNELTRNGWDVRFVHQDDDTGPLVAVATKGNVVHSAGFVNEVSLLNALQELCELAEESK